MAASKKQVRFSGNPNGREPIVSEYPDSFYSVLPSWRFYRSDKEQWSVDEKNMGEHFWKEIVPFFRSIETQTWGFILQKSKKQHHSIKVESLNKAARDRLADMYIEEESIISLRSSAKHRLYGFITNGVFEIVWFDTDHGDNSTCVCRSFKKHT